MSELVLRRNHATSHSKTHNVYPHVVGGHGSLEMATCFSAIWHWLSLMESCCSYCCRPLKKQACVVATSRQTPYHPPPLPPKTNNMFTYTPFSRLCLSHINDEKSCWRNNRPTQAFKKEINFLKKDENLVVILLPPALVTVHRLRWGERGVQRSKSVS